MRRLRWDAPTDQTMPKRPYRDTVLVYGGMAVVVVVIALLTGGGFVKALVIACNSASAACLRDARERYEVPVVEVVLPAVRRAVAATRNQQIGVIGTVATILHIFHLIARLCTLSPQLI